MVLNKQTIFAAALTLGSIASVSAQVPIVLRASPFGPPGHLLNKRILSGWSDAVSKATEGRVKVEVLPAAVAPPLAILDAVKTGLADLSLMSNGASSTMLPLNSLVEFAGQTPSAEKSSMAYQGVVQRHPAFAAEYGDVKLLGVFTHGPGVLLMSAKGAAALSELSTLTLNAGGAGGGAVVQDLGAKVVITSHPPRPEMLAAGQADGTVTTIDSYGSFNLASVVKAVVTMPNGFYTAGFALAANANKWNSLDARDREAILKVSGPVLARLAGRAWDEGDAVAVQSAQIAGISQSVLSITQATQMAAAGEKRQQRWLEDLGSKATDAKAALAEYRAEVLAP